MSYYSSMYEGQGECHITVACVRDGECHITVACMRDGECHITSACVKDRVSVILQQHV